MLTSLCFLALAAPLVQAASGTDDWPQWRGPGFDGASEVAGLPSEWSATENVAWRTELLGPSAATPIVWGDRIFLTALESETQNLLALALDRATGEIVWGHECGNGVLPSPRSRGRENTLAACSPVTDGEVVCFLFGSGDLVAFDFAGATLWTRNLVQEYGRFAIQWGYAASPLFFGGKLYVSVVHRAASYLLAVDPKTGKNLWKHAREDAARAESQEAYTTPIPFDNQGRWEILVLGGDCLTAHDPETGEETWRWSGLNPRKRGNFRTVSTTVVGEDGMIFVTSPQHNPMHALRVDGDEVAKVWERGSPTPDATTPLYYRGRLYAVDGRRGRMVCIEPATGKAVWVAELDLPSFVRASPTGADGKIYVMDAEGNVVVLAAGDEFRELARVALDSYPSRSTIVADDGQLLIRTAEHLYCIGAAR